VSGGGELFVNQISIRELVKLILQIIGLMLAVVFLLILLLWGWDVHQDRKHTVTIVAPTPVFAGSGGEDCDARSKLTILQPGAAVRVRRIRYWKNCATIDIALPDNRRGTLVSGRGDFDLKPTWGQ
jgi:hypothetical protein